MRKILILLLLSTFFISCGTSENNSSSPTPQEKRCENNPPIVIFSQDIYDDDNHANFAQVIAMHKNCEIELKAILITGNDAHKKAGILVSSIIKYYEEDIPYGYLPNIPQRYTPVKETSPSPVKDPRYSGYAESIDDFESSGCLDDQPCAQNFNSISLLCEVLGNSPDNSVTFSTGGHLTNLAEFLKSNNCNNISLFSKKVKKVLLGTGYTNGINGKPEMNFSQGEYGNSPAAEATKSFFSLIPNNVEVIVFQGKTPVHQNGVWGPIGDVYLNFHLNSPMAFMTSIKNYYSYDTLGLGDFEVIYSMTDESWFRKVNACFSVNQTNGSLSLTNGCENTNFFYSEPAIENVAETLFIPKAKNLLREWDK